MVDVAPGYFHLLAVALHSARLYRNCIICGLGEVDNPDMMAEMADLLLRHPRAVWTLCYGRHGGRVLLSLRTSGGAKRAKQLIRRVVGRDGTGGGHNARAGGQIPLPECSPGQWARVEREIRGRMLRALKLSGRRGSSLIGRRAITKAPGP